jgi:hypothetical protein
VLLSALHGHEARAIRAGNAVAAEMGRKTFPTYYNMVKMSFPIPDYAPNN